MDLLLREVGERESRESRGERKSRESGREKRREKASVYTNMTIMCILIHKVSLNLFIIYTGVKTEEKRASPQGKTYSIMYID